MFPAVQVKENVFVPLPEWKPSEVSLYLNFAVKSYFGSAAKAG
ncbi:hypothetical protein [Luteimicrobium subarcticum]|nr:hypothetical protein [Luteimicrobium subarcticum]